jgi:hypothetical protein
MTHSDDQVDVALMARGIRSEEEARNELTTREQTELERCEDIIRRGLHDFIVVGVALLTVREFRLYRAKFSTFEDYCRGRWGMTSARARQLCAAGETVFNLENVTDVPPANEAQARPLMALSAPEQREAGARAVATAPNGPPTGDHVQAVVAEMFPRDGAADAGTPPPVDADGWALAPEEPEPQPAPRPTDDAQKAADSWYRICQDHLLHVNSLYRMGGIRRLTRKWSRERKESYLDSLTEIAGAYLSMRAKLAADLAAGDPERPDQPPGPPAVPWRESELERKAVVEAGGSAIADLMHDHRLIAWAQAEGRFVRIDMGTDWANPFLVHHDAGSPHEAVELFERVYLPYKPSLRRRLGELRGKVLGCWCEPGYCHGDILIRAAYQDIPAPVLGGADRR